MTNLQGVVLADVSVTFVGAAGPVHVLRTISLEIERGTSLAITGPSGSGKSTLIALMGGLALPTTGHVCVDGVTLSCLSERKRTQLRRDTIGFIFQTDSLLAFLTALENVEQQLALSGRPANRTACAELLATVGLAAHLDQLPDTLSGGQRQRVAVARALVHRPQLVLADEPTGSLDATASARVIDLLMSMHNATGNTLVVVTHDGAVAARLDRIIELGDGVIVGDTAERGAFRSQR